MKRLRSIRGVGEWTAQYIALRQLREPDAFPAADIGLLRAEAIAGNCEEAQACAARIAEVLAPQALLARNPSL